MGAVSCLAETSVPIVHIDIRGARGDTARGRLTAALKERCSFLITGGDIKDAADARRFLAAGADAVAIASAAMNDPRLVGKIQQALRA